MQKGINMNIYYSPSKDSFFPDDLKDIYELNGSWPGDVEEVDYHIFKQFSLDLAPIGKIRSYNAERGIYWVDAPSTGEDVYISERVWRNEELKRADEELNKVQDADPKARGTVGDWRTYRKALRNYPETDGFPNKAYRPVSP